MAADALSDVLKTVRLTGATFFDVVAAAPWVAESPPREMILPKILPGAEHLIAYHVITEGHCFANIIGEEPIAIEAGEVIVFTKSDPHILSSSPGMRAQPVAPDALEAATASQLPFFINYGGHGPASAKFVCGYLACDAHPFNPLLNNLPPVIKVRGKEGDDSNWLSQFIRVAMLEIGEQTRRRRKRAGQTERVDVHRGGPSASGSPLTGAGRMARGSARPVRRQGFVADARKAGMELDYRGISERRRALALGAGGTLCRPRRHATHVLSRKMADADRFRAPER